MTEEDLEKAVDEVFERIENIAFYTAQTAKDVILRAYQLEMTPSEYLTVVSSYINDFEKSKEGTKNED